MRSPSAAISWSLKPHTDENGVEWRRVRVHKTAPPGSIVRIYDRQHGGCIAEIADGDSVDVLQQALGTGANTKVCIIPPQGDA